jgi:hypothetical protein
MCTHITTFGVHTRLLGRQHQGRFQRRSLQHDLRDATVKPIRVHRWSGSTSIFFLQQKSTIQTMGQHKTIPQIGQRPLHRHWDGSARRFLVPQIQQRTFHTTHVRSHVPQRDLFLQRRQLFVKHRQCLREKKKKRRCIRCETDAVPNKYPTTLVRTCREVVVHLHLVVNVVVNVVWGTLTTLRSFFLSFNSNCACIRSSVAILNSSLRMASSATSTTHSASSSVTSSSIEVNKSMRSFNQDILARWSRALSLS